MNINEPIQQETASSQDISQIVNSPVEPAEESGGIFKEFANAVKIICLRNETISAVSQSKNSLKYGLIFMLLPNILLFFLILLSGVYVGFTVLLVSLAQSFLIIGLSFVIARFLFNGRGTLGGYFRPASYSFIFLVLTPVIVLIYAPLPAFASLLALFLVFFGFWNIIVLAKTLKHTQSVGMVKSLASVLAALFILSLGLSAPISQKLEPEPFNLELQNSPPIIEEQSQQSDKQFPADVAQPPAPRQSALPPAGETTWDDVNRETVMGGMSTQIMNQISNGIWSGNFYGPSSP